MKKRRAEAEVTARQHGRDEAARKRAHQFFDHMITNIVEARIFQQEEEDDDDDDEESDESEEEEQEEEKVVVDDVTQVMTAFDRYCDDTPELDQLVRTYTVVARDDPLGQLKIVKRSLTDGVKAIEKADRAMKQGNRITKGLAALST